MSESETKASGWAHWKRAVVVERKSLEVHLPNSLDSIIRKAFEGATGVDVLVPSADMSRFAIIKRGDESMRVSLIQSNDRVTQDIQEAIRSLCAREPETA